MAGVEGSLETCEALERIDALLDAVDHAGRSDLGPAERLELCTRARQLAGRLEALAAVLLSEADRIAAAPQAEGLTSSLWLANTQHLAGNEARRLVRAARELGDHPVVREAALAGSVSVPKASAITKVLGRLPELTDDERAAAETILIGAASERTAGELARMTEDVLQRVRPDESPGAQQERVERETTRAKEDRFLTFLDDGQSVIIWASLPRHAAAPLVAYVEAHADTARRRALESRDPDAREITTRQRRADALIALASSAADEPGLAQARVLVTMTLEQLTAPDGLARTLAGESLTAGGTRRLLCDAGIVPVVLGGPSEVLDVGREQRLVTPAQRTALTLRDGGCVFPDCDVPAQRCEAHHIIPWNRGGPTTLANLALLCPSHHGSLEPTAGRPGVQPERWEIRMAADGLPELIPPVRVCADRTPRRHSRIRRRRAPDG